MAASPIFLKAPIPICSITEKEEVTELTDFSRPSKSLPVPDFSRALANSFKDPFDCFIPFSNL